MEALSLCAGSYWNWNNFCLMLWFFPFYQILMNAARKSRAAIMNASITLEGLLVNVDQDSYLVMTGRLACLVSTVTIWVELVFVLQ